MSWGLGFCAIVTCHSVLYLNACCRRCKSPSLWCGERRTPGGCPGRMRCLRGAQAAAYGLARRAGMHAGVCAAGAQARCLRAAATHTSMPQPGAYVFSNREKIEWGREFAKYPSVQEFISLPGVGHCPHVRAALAARHRRLLRPLPGPFSHSFCLKNKRRSSSLAAHAASMQDEAPDQVNPLILKFVECVHAS